MTTIFFKKLTTNKWKHYYENWCVCVSEREREREGWNLFVLHKQTKLLCSSTIYERQIGTSKQTATFFIFFRISQIICMINNNNVFFCVISHYGQFHDSYLKTIRDHINKIIVIITITNNNKKLPWTYAFTHTHTPPPPPPQKKRRVGGKKR